MKFIIPTIIMIMCLSFAFAKGSGYVKHVEPVVPIEEQLSHYGNPISYQIDGEIYRVLRSSKGFHQIGLASWYGDDFHLKRTSSGEVYDMYAITAAHKTLPLPSYVRVINLSNGRSIIVRVNDRGPFYSGRIIDLSYTAAFMLGFLQKGTVEVSVDAVSMPSYVSPAGQYFLQIASLSAPSRAKNLKNRLEKEFDLPIEVRRVTGLYVISLGPFSKLERLQQVQYKLTQLGFDDTLPVIR